MMLKYISLIFHFCVGFDLQKKINFIEIESKPEKFIEDYQNISFSKAWSFWKKTFE